MRSHRLAPLVTSLTLLLASASSREIHHTARPYSTRQRHYEAQYPSTTAPNTNIAIPLATDAPTLSPDIVAYPEFDTPPDLQLEFDALAAGETDLKKVFKREDGAGEQVALVPAADAPVHLRGTFEQGLGWAGSGFGSWRNGGEGMQMQTEGGAQFALFGAIFAGALLLA